MATTATVLELLTRTLASYWVEAELYGTSQLSCSATSLITDGRTRKGLWKKLVDGGYISPCSESGKGQITNKAFLELPSSDVVLTDMWQFDPHESDKGHDFVAWDRLHLHQKKHVILALKADPKAYTLMMVDKYNRKTIPPVPFGLGGAGDAREKAGGWHNAFMVVTSPQLEEAGATARRAHYKQQVVETALNWYLQRVKAIEPEQEVPVRAKQTLSFGGFGDFGFGLSLNPEMWAGSMKESQDKAKERIRKAKETLETLQRVEAYVEQIGGWDKLRADYDEAVEAYVDKAMKE